MEDDYDDIESSSEDFSGGLDEEARLSFDDVVSFTMLMEFAITFVSIVIFMGYFIYKVR